VPEWLRVAVETTSMAALIEEPHEALSLE